jgi:hypothetical protein
MGFLLDDQRAYRELRKQLVLQECNGLRELVVGLSQESSRDTASETLVDGATDFGGLAEVL